MGSTWKCLQLPSAGVQPVHGLGEGHYLTNSSRTRRRDCNTVRSCGMIKASRRKSPTTPLKNQHKTFFIPGCVSMGWSERFQTHAHENNNRSISSENSWEDTTGKRNAFKDFDDNGDYMKLSRGSSSGDSDLFRDEKDWEDSEKDGGLWADSGRDGDSENSTSSDDGYSSPWENDDGSSDNGSSSSSGSSSVGSAADSLAIGGKEPIYQVLEVHPGGDVAQREVSRRQLLRSIAGLRLRDIRSVDPSLWVTNSVPAILVRDQAILLNLGSLRAIATSQSVLIFEQKSVGAEAFMGALLPRLRTANGQGPIMPFELEVVEAALISRTQRLERMLMDVEPRVMASLKVLPIRYTGDVLEELRLGKQALVELAAKAGALRQMLLEMLEHPEDIRKMTIMGRTCKVRRQDGSIECTLPLDKQSAEDEEEEIEMLLEYYLQRCDSCHGQAEKLLDAAKEMEDSIGVNLSSRRLEVSRLELLLQVGTFCSALGALVAGIFGMNLKSYLEERAMAFYITTGGIIFGGIALFIVMYRYLRARKIL